MGIGPVVPVQQETAASASSQASLTRRDRELQVEEGQPPIEVPEAELEALRWRKNEELRDKRKKRSARQQSGSKASDSDRAEFESADAETVEAEEAGTDERAQTELSGQLPNKESEEEESAGTLFDSRS